MVFPSLTSAFLMLLLSLSAFPHLFLAQQQADPTITSCVPLLLPLVPCAPFVQGTATSPTQPCCNSLVQLYTQQPACLCLLLNNPSTLLTIFPINTTIASQLPLLCNLQPQNTTICSGVQVPANPPASQIPSGQHSNTTTAASPAVIGIPKSSILGYKQSKCTKLKIKSHLAVLIAAYIYI